MAYSDPEKRRAWRRAHPDQSRSEMTEEERERARANARDYYERTKGTRRADGRARYKADPEGRRQYARDVAAQLRQEMLDAYGRACTCCGEDEEAFLTLEHVNGDGKADRAAQGGKNQGVLRRLKKEGWPKEGYTVLCFNCNCARWRTGVCPHQRRVLELVSCA